MYYNTLLDMLLNSLLSPFSRRMFPVVKASISGLEPDSLYAVVMDIVPVGDNRFKFHDSEWVVTGKAEPMGSEKGRLFVHPDSPATGASWEKQIITFQKCKITNNHLDQLGYVSVAITQYDLCMHAAQGNMRDFACISE